MQIFFQRQHIVTITKPQVKMVIGTLSYHPRRRLKFHALYVLDSHSAVVASGNYFHDKDLWQRCLVSRV